MRPIGAADAASDSVHLEVVRYDDPDARILIGEVQAEYVRRYGGPDRSPVDPAEFASPSGVFLVLYGADGEPTAMGGWRTLPDQPRPTVEIKRMYVRPDSRGRGFARLLLAELEAKAAGRGMRRVLLETGHAQPEAIALYRSSGYVDAPPYGYYAETDGSLHLSKDLA